MVATVNASTSAGVVVTSDTSGSLALQTANTTALTISSGQVVSLANALPVASGGTGLTSFTTNGIPYATSTSALATGSSLVWTGTAMGIGTSSPAYTLDVARSGTGFTARIGNGTTATYFYNDGSSTYIGGDSAINNCMYIYPAGNQIGWATTNGTTKMLLDSSGSLLVGTTTSPGGGGNIKITGTYNTSNATPMSASGVGANPGTTAIFDGSGNLYKQSSSLRYKENITDWTVTNEQLNAFINVNPKLWDYIGKENGCAGFIAEDIEALGLKNAYNTSPLINYSNEGLPDSNRDFALIALQHKVLQKQEQAIQELSTQVTELKAEVQALKGA